MCGLFGWITSRERSPGLERLKYLTDLLAHRGPDSSGYVELHTANGAHSVGLGHRRLSIIDLSPAGSQPMWSDDREMCLIFNGEIYNYIELRQELSGLGFSFRSDSDTEVLMAAVRAWGADAVTRFRGMFAFVLFDIRQDLVLLARDPFGKKPLFIGQSGEDVFFSSEIEPITASPGFDRRFDWNALSDFLLDRYVAGPNTFFKGVQKLPPGSLAIWRNGEFNIRRYFVPPIARVQPDIFDHEVAKRMMRETVEDAVKIRLRSDAPYGAFLSGGLDSTAVVGIMAGHLSTPVRTFSVGFSEPEFSELDYCRFVAERFGTEHQELVVEPKTFFDNWSEAVLRRGAPVSEPSDIPMMLLSKAASRSVKMVLTGEGADEVLGGYPKHVAEPYVALYHRLISPAVHDRLVTPLVKLLPYQMRRVKVLAKALGERNPRDRMRVWFGDLSPKERDLLFDGHVETGSHDPFPFSYDGPSALRRLQFFDQTSWLPDNTFERADRMMMAGSIEGLMPLIDSEFVELAARLPDKFIVRGFRGKRILREAFSTLIPQEVLQRRKNGFRVPVNKWFKKEGRELVHSLLSAEDSRIRTILNKSVLDRIVREHMEDRINNERVIWSLCNLEYFLRVYRPSFD